jgi:regulator of protease activity HflC (stomatin/prohibitin superfamily)
MAVQRRSSPYSNSNSNSSDSFNKFLGELKMKTSAMIAIVVFVGVLLLAAVFGPKIGETVDGGTYHVKQAAFSGEMSAVMKPGFYWQNFGEITKFPVSETFYFTHDKEGGAGDFSIDVMFMDGSKCKLSGTCRVDMPRLNQEAIDLITKHGYRDHDQVETKLLLPTIRRSLVMTANFYSAKESYSNKRGDFLAMAWDQIEKGLYVTKEKHEKGVDDVSGAAITIIKKEVVLNDDGTPMREKNPLDGTGIKLSNFEIKEYLYEERVAQQIKTQQELTMAVQTAMAKAREAEQTKLTSEAQGQADVMKAKYEKETEKMRATVEAEKEKAVAVITAQKLVDIATKEKEQALVVANRNREVSEIELKAAMLEKQRQIELGTGESERRRMVLAADGALTQKLDAFVTAQTVWAAAFKERKVPTMIMGGGSGSTDKDALGMNEMLTLMFAKQMGLNLDLSGSGNVTHR